MTLITSTCIKGTLLLFIEVLLRVNEQRNIQHEIRKRKANWIGHKLRRNCRLKQVIEGKLKGEMEVTRRRGRRRKKLLDDFREGRGYCHLKEEALNRPMWGNRFGGDIGPVITQTAEWMNELNIEGGRRLASGIVDSCSASRKFLFAAYGFEGSLPYSHESSTGPYSEARESAPPHTPFLGYILILSRDE